MKIIILLFSFFKRKTETQKMKKAIKIMHPHATSLPWEKKGLIINLLA